VFLVQEAPRKEAKTLRMLMVILIGRQGRMLGQRQPFCETIRPVGQQHRRAARPRGAGGSDGR
jgi:hypothetical protein